MNARRATFVLCLFIASGNAGNAAVPSRADLRCLEAPGGALANADGSTNTATSMGVGAPGRAR